MGPVVVGDRAAVKHFVRARPRNSLPRVGGTSQRGARVEVRSDVGTEDVAVGVLHGGVDANLKVRLGIARPHRDDHAHVASVSDRHVRVDRYNNDWAGRWWFAGRRK